MDKIKTSSSIDDLDANLLIDIFQRIPLDYSNPPTLKLISDHLNSLIPLSSLFQLRKVSNRWNSVISSFLPPNPDPTNRPIGLIFECDPCVNPQSRYYPKRVHSYVLYLDTKKIHPPFRTFISTNDPWHQRAKVLHSCNGLLLCRSKRDHRLYYVCNPTTNKFSKLPKLPDRSNKLVLRMFLAFDPSRSPHYKVVCVLEYNKNSYRFEVYSSKACAWRKCGEVFTTDVRFDFNNGVYWKGAIHWISETGKSIFFNPDDDDPKVVAMPPIHCDDSGGFKCYFGESCDHLHTIVGVGRELYVYEMRRDYSEWFVKYKVNVSDSRFHHIYALVRGKRDEDTFLVLWMGWNLKRIVRYNLVYETYETIFDHSGAGHSLVFPGKKRALPYIESLSSV